MGATAFWVARGKNVPTAHPDRQSRRRWVLLLALQVLPVRGPRAADGVTSCAGGGLRVFCADAARNAGSVALCTAGPGITEVYSGDGSLFATLASERREILPLDKIPQSMLDAVIAIEDRRFYEHRGLDLRGFVRTMQVKFYSGRMRQGGSTLTQQVAKAFLGADRTVSRKIREAILARRLEARYSKAEILQTYLNHTPSSDMAATVSKPRRSVFDKNIWDLPVEDQAVLAGLLKAPTRYSPIDHPQAAQQRRNLVLRKMVEVGKPMKRRRPSFWQADRAPAATGHFAGCIAVLRQSRPQRADRNTRRATVMETVCKSKRPCSHFSMCWQGKMSDFAVRRLDKRQGYRGAEANLIPTPSACFSCGRRSATLTRSKKTRFTSGW